MQSLIFFRYTDGNGNEKFDDMDIGNELYASRISLWWVYSQENKEKT